MNDPNGLFYWQGRYHLFYQFNPYGPTWGFIHWGHASSPDLVHWEDHPIALQPTQGAGDANGCWSGCVVDDHGVPTAIYTGFVNPENTPVMLARAKDPGLLAWKKSVHNPIIPDQPEGVNNTDFRDPYVWREGDSWKMIIGAGLESGEGAVLLYHSEDLIDWNYLGPLFEGRTLASVQMWECPNFFPLDDQYVLLVSLFPGILGVYYYVGKYDGRSFTPHQEGFLTDSPFFYAPQVRRLKDDRTILFGWLLEGREEAAMQAAGWAGVQSLPQELSLDEKGRLTSRPIGEVKSLREDLFQMAELDLQEGERRKLPVSGRHLELVLSLGRSGAGLRLDLLTSSDGEESVSLYLKRNERRMELDLRESSHATQVRKPCLKVDLPEFSTEALNLRVFIDGSVIEVWLNDRIGLTGRAYPMAEHFGDLYLSSLGGGLKVRELKIWKMKAVWPAASE